MTRPYEDPDNAQAQIDCSSMIPTSLRPSDKGRWMTCLAQDAGPRPDVNIKVRMETLQRENRERAGQTEADLVAASAAGKLWTVQAALYPNRVFCCVFHGRQEDVGALASQHQSAPTIFGPVYLISKTQKSAMLKAFELFSVRDITVRVIL